jgi:hypothetical protein
MYNFEIAPKICKYYVVYCNLYNIAYLSFSDSDADGWTHSSDGGDKKCM